MDKIALIACVKDKQDRPMFAWEMYQGEDFKSWWKDAEQRGAHFIYILSGKYGLLHPEQIIEPYDFNLNEASEDEQKAWAKAVLDKLRQHHDLQKDHFIIYANEHYRKYLVPNMTSYEVPFDID